MSAHVERSVWEYFLWVAMILNTVLVILYGLGILRF